MYLCMSIILIKQSKPQYKGELMEDSDSDASLDLSSDGGDTEYDD